ncbi:MAG: 5-bromo-4-chloroindolyl phosphate hydrolysis family protein [Pseudomonadota bacterium]
MAQRYGGKFSPDGSSDAADGTDVTPYTDAKPRKAGARINLLFLAPLPLLGTIWGSTEVEFGLKAVGGAALLLAAWLTREGVLAHEAYDARNVARRPAIPRKIFASVLIALGLTLVAWTNSGLLGLIPGLVGMGLHLFAFGADPMKDKGFDGINAFQQNRVAVVVEEAEKSLTIMEATAQDLGDRTMEARIGKFTARARTLFRRVEEDPQDLTAARKFLSVYLTGAKDATQKFAALYKRNRDPQVRAEFETFLDDLETNFAAKTDTLLANNKTDLDIEMKVLRDRLAREGLTPEQ